MEAKLFAAFKPDADALLRHMSKYIDNAALERIAKLDDLGGRERVAFIANHLQMLRDNAAMPNPISGDLTASLIECTQLEPDVDRIQRHKDRRYLAGHWERAYACTVMLRAYGHSATRSSSGPCNYTLIQLLGSLQYLDVSFESEIMANVAWLILRMAEDTFHVDYSERAFMGVGLLSLAAKSKAISDAIVLELTRWLLNEERRKGMRGDDFPDHWLLRKTFFTSAARKWIALGSELASFRGKGPRGDAVREIGQLMAGQTRVP